jgi:hypothetical protein
VSGGVNRWVDFTDGSTPYLGVNPVVDAKLLLNGHDRFNTMKGDYFNNVQPYQSHTRGPMTGINLYSFALTPEQHQPSGSCNFSRIENATLQLNVSTSTNPVKLYVFARSYNVLRIMAGMGGFSKVDLKSIQVKLLNTSEIVMILQHFQIAGNSLKLKDTKVYYKKYTGQDMNLGKVKNLLDWTIRSKASNVVVLIRHGRIFNDYTLVGMRSLINFDECLRYNLLHKSKDVVSRSLLKLICLILRQVISLIILKKSQKIIKQVLW